jgi:hypothetical protein
MLKAVRSEPPWSNAKELSKPGQGFFDTIANYRNMKIDKSQQFDLWVAEVNAAKTYYKKK